MSDERKTASGAARRIQIYAPVDLEGGTFDAQALMDHIHEVWAIMDLANQDDDA